MLKIIKDEFYSISRLAIILWVFPIILLGCASHFCPDCSINYKKGTYIPNKYTCAHICADYSRHLNGCDYDSRVVVGPVRGLKKPHAWIEIIYDGETYWEEITWGLGCFPVSQWTDRKAEWKYECNVTGHEVHTYQKVKRY